jgi:hypothetical protein
MIKRLKESKFAKKALHIAFVSERYFLAVKMHLSIVWRRWDDYEDEEGNIHKTYIDWSTAWTVAKGVWLDGFNAR